MKGPYRQSPLRAVFPYRVNTPLLTTLPESISNVPVLMVGANITVLPISVLPNYELSESNNSNFIDQVSARLLSA